MSEALVKFTLEKTKAVTGLPYGRRARGEQEAGQGVDVDREGSAEASPSSVSVYGTLGTSPLMLDRRAGQQVFTSMFTQESVGSYIS